MGTKKYSTNRCLGIVFRDGADLFLVLSVCRGPKGDVYVNFPRDYKPSWKPHTSYHASGHHHHKSYGHKALVQQRQKPNQQFMGSENVVTTSIASDEPRAIGKVCQASDFDAIVEIPVTDLGYEKYSTMLSVDITQPGSPPITTPNAKILRSEVFKDATPWIHVTLFDTGSHDKKA